MSAKRQASQNIDEKTLQHKANDVPAQQQVSKQSTQQPKDRQVVSVKKQGDNNTVQTGQSKVETVKDQAKPTLGSGLFSGNLFTNNSITTPQNGSGLFTNNGTLGSGLFSNNTGTTGSGLFSNANKPTTTGLFGSTTTQPKTGGLFSTTPASSTTGGSIFNFQSSGVPPIKNSGASLFASKQNDDDDSGDSAELQAAQNLQADPTKSSHHYKYQQTCKLILKQKAFKFKKIGGDLIQNVDIVITQDKQSQIYYITVQLPATKKSIYTGLLLVNKSQVKHLNNKKQNVQVSAFMIVNKKPQQAILRLQFEKEQQGVLLHDTIEQIVKGTFVGKQSGEDNDNGEKQISGEKKEAIKSAVQSKQSN